MITFIGRKKIPEKKLIILQDQERFYYRTTFQLASQKINPIVHVRDEGEADYWVFWKFRSILAAEENIIFTAFWTDSLREKAMKIKHSILGFDGNLTSKMLIIKKHFNVK